MNLRNWLRGPMCKLYTAHALSSWGDRMWWFAGGIFMKDIGGTEYQNLQLTAIFSLAISSSVVLFGAPLGRWVDGTSRIRAYGTTQISTSLIGGAQGLAAMCGVMGSVSYPFLRRCLLQEYIGILGLALQVSALVGCMLSIWLPGSPFDPNSLSIWWTPAEELQRNEEDTSDLFHYTSVGTLFGGIILSRFGLWLADITITQILQEKIEEHKRGAVNGVQDALNMCMDMLKSVLVILFSYPQQFGLNIILSYISIFCGFLSFCIYAYTSLTRKSVEEEEREIQSMYPTDEPPLVKDNEVVMLWHLHCFQCLMEIYLMSYHNISNIIIRKTVCR